MFIDISVSNANSVDPDQTPRFAASDLGLHCLPMSLLWDARHKWIKKKQVQYGWPMMQNILRADNEDSDQTV